MNMNVFKLAMSMGMAISISLAFDCMGKEVAVRTPSGENLIVDVQPEDRFLDVIHQIESHLNGMGEAEAQNFEVDSYSASQGLALEYRQREFLVDYMVAAPQLISIQKPASLGMRDYNASLKSSEKSDIKFLITTMGNSSLPKILANKSALKKAGDRVDGVHPLRFLACIFSDEEMKAAMANLQGRTWVWTEYLNGVNDSFNTENKLNNVMQYMPDFAKNLNVDFATVNGLALNNQWTDLVDYLIKVIPRKGNPGRYDM